VRDRAQLHPAATRTGSQVLGTGRRRHPEPVVDLTKAEGIERVRKAVLGLPLHYREAIVLCDLEEMSYAEAAEAIGCAVGTVRSRVHRGRELLARKLIGTAVPGTAAPRVAGGRCFA
jgi:RNA polymerase sigma-70 factor (ECF subfamily)